MANQEDELVTAWNLVKAACEVKRMEASQEATDMDQLLTSLGCLGVIVIVFIILLVIWL